MYKVYLDQNKTFECDIKIEGADSSKSEARLVLETKDFFITFKGSIQDGKVKIPINKLKGVLKENYQGNMSLEVIAEDTFFTPWKDTFETDTLRKVEVSFNDDSKLIKETNTKTPTKPTVAVKMAPSAPKTPTAESYSNDIIAMLKENKVTFKDIAKKPRILIETVSAYCLYKKIDAKDNKTLNKILEVISDRIVNL
jgi:hypothetical protein